MTLDAKKNLHIEAAENSNKTNSNSSESSASVGAGFGIHGQSSISISGNKQNGEIKENSTTYQESNVTATEKLNMHSGEDTNIIASKASGEKVDVKVEGNLNLQSLQDKETYDEKNSSSGFGISANIAHPAAGTSGNNTVGTPNYNGSVSKGNINSDYNSVTKQAEIHAGQGGFDIEVGKNTDLKGAVISSDATPDKNKISTDTLTYSDIQNKADYSASSVGANYNKGSNTKLNEKGFTPNISTPAKGDASSTTKSAVANGTIEVRSNPNQDLSGLSRDTDKALNELGKIFDKKKIEEQQELAKLFGELAYEQVHKVSSKNKENAEKELNKAKADKNSTPEQLAALQAKVDAWSEGGANKIALHALVGGIMSDITGGGFTSGAVGAGVNEAVQKELEKRFKNQPDMWQWASALIGAAASKAVGGNAQTGASTAVSGTKNNRLNDKEREQFVQELMTALANGASAEALQEIIARYENLAMGESSVLNWAFNKAGTSIELDNDVKAFLKDQLGYDWDEAFKTIKSYNPDATDADVWDNLYG